MIQTQSQNKEIRQFVEARWKVGWGLGGEDWRKVRGVRDKVWPFVRKVWWKVWRKLFR